MNPDPGDPKKRLMTVWGQDKINVNTANAQTLLFIVCGNVPDAPLCLDVQQMQSFVMGVTLAEIAAHGRAGVLFQRTSSRR